MAAPERWWVELTPGEHAANLYSVVSSPSRPQPKPPTTVVAGSFKTRADADKWIAQQTAVHIPKVNIPGLSDLGKIGHWIGDAVLHIVDGAMWRSLGWMLLGALLIFGGVYLFFRTSQSYKDLQSAVLGTVKAL